MKQENYNFSFTFIVWVALAIVLLFYSIVNVNADTIQIEDSTDYNYYIDLRDNQYKIGRTLIQEGIITTTCDYLPNSYGCGIQVPLTTPFGVVSGKKYTFSFLVATDNRVLQVSTWKSNLVLVEDGESVTTGVWRMYNYYGGVGSAYNADVTISPQDSSSNVKIYKIDYSFTSRQNSNIKVVTFAFGENYSGSSTTGTLQFSYFMVDATNQDVVDAVNGLKTDLNNINSNITSDDDDTTSKKCGVICKLKGIFTGITELPGKIANLIKGLFVPDDFDFINDFKDVMISKLGILAQVPDMLLSFLNDIKNKEYTKQCFTMPKMSFFGYSFWDEMSFCIQDSFYYNIIKDYRWMTNIVPVFGVLFYCYNAYKKFFGEGDSE